MAIDWSKKEKEWTFWEEWEKRYNAILYTFIILAVLVWIINKFILKSNYFQHIYNSPIFYLCFIIFTILSLIGLIFQYREGSIDFGLGEANVYVDYDRNNPSKFYISFSIMLIIYLGLLTSFTYLLFSHV